MRNAIKFMPVLKRLASTLLKYIDERQHLISTYVLGDVSNARIVCIPSI